ncbi:MAG: DUF1289 domain-containing protein [Aeromonas sp.]
MEQLEIFPLQSPCIGVCEANSNGYCKGCLRNREERFNWCTMSPCEQQTVLRLCRQRKARIEAAKRCMLREAKANSQAEACQHLTPAPGWDF